MSDTPKPPVVLDATGAKEADDLPELLQISCDAHDWIEQGVTEAELADDYDLMRRVFQLLVVGGLVTTEKLEQAFDLARTLS